MDQAVKVMPASKQAAAKEAQGYDASPAPKTCRNCAHFAFELALPDWMAERNARVRVHRFTVELHGIEKNKRCGIGGFAVKKMATCRQFRPKDGT